MSAAEAVPASWSHFPHGADVGVRGIGPTAAAAFEQAALALTAIVTEPAAIAANTALAIDCAAPDLELLLVDWLNALITLSATRRLLFGSFKVAIERAGGDHWRLSARVIGDALDPSRHDLGVEAKGATMTALAVRHRADGSWLAECVIDV